jgi:hypothetical protein
MQLDDFLWPFAAKVRVYGYKESFFNENLSTRCRLGFINFVIIVSNVTAQVP